MTISMKNYFYKMIYMVVFVFIFFILTCYNRKTSYEIEKTSIKLVDYFYNNVIKKQNYHLLDNIVTSQINLMFGYDERFGTWQYEGELIGFKKRIISLQKNYGSLKKYTIIEKRSFIDYDNSIDNIEFIIKAEYERVCVKERIIMGYSLKNTKLNYDIKLIAYSSNKKCI